MNLDLTKYHDLVNNLGLSYIIPYKKLRSGGSEFEWQKNGLWKCPISSWF